MTISKTTILTCIAIAASANEKKVFKYIQSYSGNLIENIFSDGSDFNTKAIG